jgi:hypothetical protein
MGQRLANVPELDKIFTGHILTDECSSDGKIPSAFYILNRKEVKFE